MSFVGSEAVLDVGCGDGKITAEFARALPRGYVLGVDSSPEFIAYASRHYPKALFSSLQFEVMDARSLNTNNRFDLVFSNAAMHWVDDHSAFLRGVAKHLRIGGRLVLSCGGAGNASGIIAALEMVTSSSAWERYFGGFHFPYYFYSPKEYSAWLPEANLTAVRCELVAKDMIHDGPESLAGWIRTTWWPYTQRLPEELRERFINDCVSRYSDKNSPDESGHTHVHMIRLEVEAVKLR
jgi:trans-aconitate 2-methyltransferase